MTIKSGDITQLVMQLSANSMILTPIPTVDKGLKYHLLTQSPRVKHYLIESIIQYNVLQLEEASKFVLRNIKNVHFI